MGLAIFTSTGSRVQWMWTSLALAGGYLGELSQACKISSRRGKRVCEGLATVRRFQGQGTIGTWVSGVLGVAGARCPLPVFHTYFSD